MQTSADDSFFLSESLTSILLNTVAIISLNYEKKFTIKLTIEKKTTTKNNKYKILLHFARIWIWMWLSADWS